MTSSKYGKLISFALLSGLFLAGCSSATEQAPGSEIAPHEVIAEVVDFEGEVADIEMQYTKEGQDWLRMSFPDLDHRAYALKHIGKHVPDVAFTTLKGQDISLQDIDEPTIFYFTQTGSGITEEMAGYMDTFQNERDDIAVYSIFPSDDAASVKTFYDENTNAFDEDLIVVGKEATAITEAFSVSNLPLLVYVDETQTISYTAIGFRDLVFMKDHAETAFGEHRFYEWMDVEFEGEEEITE